MRLVGNASDAVTLANNIKIFIEERNLYSVYGSNGREYFREHFTKEIHINNISKKY